MADQPIANPDVDPAIEINCACKGKLTGDNVKHDPEGCKRFREMPTAPAAAPKSLQAQAERQTKWDEQSVQFGGAYIMEAVPFAFKLASDRRLVLRLACNLAWLAYHKDADLADSDSAMQDRLTFFGSKKVSRAARRRFLSYAVMCINATANAMVELGTVRAKAEEDSKIALPGRDFDASKLKL